MKNNQHWQVNDLTILGKSGHPTGIYNSNKDHPLRKILLDSYLSGTSYEAVGTSLAYILLRSALFTKNMSKV